jgi:hypothetical protein
LNPPAGTEQPAGSAFAVHLATQCFGFWSPFDMSQPLHCGLPSSWLACVVQRRFGTHSFGGGGGGGGGVGGSFVSRYAVWLTHSGELSRRVLPRARHQSAVLPT